MKKHVQLALRIIVAFILIQTLRFKFTANLDSVYVFKKVGLEPYGRIGIGILELVAGILLLVPKAIWLGAIVSMGIVGGAIFMHLTKLGIVIKNNGGVLFCTALLTFTLSAIILHLYRKDIPLIRKIHHN